jgi:DNA helicase II / ATP-dependent DNA helicase PcrA
MVALFEGGIFLRIVLNQEYLFLGIPKERQEKYYKRILDLSNAINNEGGITRKVIDQFKIKKMQGTETIFKFYLSNDGARCLMKYEESDNQIFDNEPGIVLLRAVEHDDQGKVGRAFDSKYQDYENFLILNEKEDQYIGKDQAFDDYLGKQYMKTIYTPSQISDHEFIEKMTQIDSRVMYKLSDSQLDVIKAQGPIFLLGCAGSGKTLIEVSKALKNAHHMDRQGYFTYTPMLREVAIEIYKKYESMKGIQGVTEFYCLKNFLLDQLGLNESQYVDFYRFETWYKTNRFESKYKWLSNIGTVNLWTEIRGILKGYIGNDFYRVLEINSMSELLKRDDIKMLLDENIIQRKLDSSTQYVISNSEKLFEYAEEFYPKLHQFLLDQDMTKPILDHYSYIYKIKQSYSLYDEDTRKQIHDFVTTIYQPYLDDNLLYDDNDLVRLLLKKVKTGDIELFDYVLVDELQDLTEFQVYVLTKLAKHPKQVLMSGDVSQIINPTFFKKGRMGVIFKNLFKTPLNMDLKLDENYRNSESIIAILSDLLQIRRETLGKYSDDIEEVSRELIKRVGLPFFVDTTVDDFLPILSTWIGIPRVAIIVASEDTKAKLKRELKIKGATNIYTVQEVKGQEFDKIITYDIISEHLDEWDFIMNYQVEKGGDLVDRYKYYFNLLYVAITRGKDNLFLFESDKHAKIIRELLPKFELLSDNIHDVMNLKEYDTKEHRIQQAVIHFNNEDYERARTYYLQLDNKKMAAICTALKHLKNGHFDEGVIHLYQFSEYHKKAYEYTERKSLKLFRMLLGDRTRQLSIHEITKLAENDSLIKLVKQYKNRSIYPRLFRDTLQLMNKIYQYKTEQQINSLIRG